MVEREDSGADSGIKFHSGKVHRHIGTGGGGGGTGGMIPQASFHKLLTTLCVVITVPPQSKCLSYATEV